ncbi:MAG: acyl-CoA thioesterase [Spongiibacteraceae bacterium]
MPRTEKKSRWQAEAEIEIPFHDVDMLRVAWHGHYAKYFEIARGKLMDSIGYNYAEMVESGYAWPVIEMHVRYAQGLHYQQRIRVQASLVEYENRLKVDYLISDAATGRRLTRGYTIQVAVTMPGGELCFESPKILFDKLGVSL